MPESRGAGIFSGQTHGLCGFFNFDSTDDFTVRNGTKFQNCKSGGRYNNANVNAWASSFAATEDGDVPLLSSKYKKLWNTAGHPMELFDVQEPSVPTPEQQEDLNKIEFKSLDEINEAQENCLALFPDSGLDSEHVQNCVYDATILPNDFTLAASNQVAAAVNILLIIVIYLFIYLFLFICFNKKLIMKLNVY